MLHPVRSSSPLPVPAQVADQPAIRQPAAASPDTTAVDRPFLFENLPAELLREVASHVFRASVNQAGGPVDVLAGNTRLRSALSAELHAAEVLRDIQGSRDLHGLLAEMDGIHQLLPNYRQGCLAAVVQMLPRMEPPGALPQTLWAQLEALLPTLRPASESDPDDTDPRTQLLLQLARTLHRHTPRSVHHLEHLLALVGRHDLPVAPELAQALLRWSSELLGRPGLTGVRATELRKRLLSAAPPGLLSPMGGLCRFSEMLAGDAPRNDGEGEGAGMVRMLAEAPATDRPHYLRVGAEDWGFHAVFQTRTAASYQELFQGLEPQQQMALLQEGRTPLSHEDVEKFLLARIGQIPVTTLARICRAQCSPRLSPDKARLIRALVQASVGTPQLAQVIHCLSDHYVAHDPQMHAFMAEHAALTGDADRQAITLRLDLQKVGCGDNPPLRSIQLLAMSYRVDDLVEGRTPVPPNVVETLADMGVRWLDLRQRSLLLDRIRELPPARCARALARLIDALPSLPRADAPALARRAIAACEDLPPEHQAAPLSQLLQVTRRIEPHRGELSRAASRLHQALPVGLRPALDARLQAALLPPEA